MSVIFILWQSSMSTAKKGPTDVHTIVSKFKSSTVYTAYIFAQTWSGCRLQVSCLVMFVSKTNLQSGFCSVAMRHSGKSGGAGARLNSGVSCFFCWLVTHLLSLMVLTPLHLTKESHYCETYCKGSYHFCPTGPQSNNIVNSLLQLWCASIINIGSASIVGYDFNVDFS